MTTEEKCVAIIKKMVEFANNDQPVTISEDWKSKFACTIAIGDSHTHVGLWDRIEGSSFELMIDNMYDVMHGDGGLSFAEGKS